MQWIWHDRDYYVKKLCLKYLCIIQINYEKQCKTHTDIENFHIESDDSISLTLEDRGQGGVSWLVSS